MRMSLIILVSHRIHLGGEVGEAIEHVFGTGIFNSDGMCYKLPSRVFRKSLKTNTFVGEMWKLVNSHKFM